MAMTTLTVLAPIPNITATPLVTPATVGDGSAANSVFINFAGTSGPGSIAQLSIYNTGGQAVFLMLNVPSPLATYFPTAAVSAASVASNIYTPGVFMLPAGAALILNNALITNVGFICASGLTTTVETVAMQASETSNGLLG